MRSRLAALGAALVALALAAPPALAEGPNHPLLRTIAGSDIGAAEEFKDACGVALDDHGNVYIADYYKNRILVIDSELRLLTRILNVEPPVDGNPLDGPCDLAVDPLGNLYVNNWHRNVVRFTPSEFPPEVGTTYGATAPIDSNHPTSVAIDPTSGNVLVDDRTYVAEYPYPVLPGDEPVRKIGLGTLASGYGVAVSDFPGTPEIAGTDGWIYVADGADDTVKVYDPDVSLSAPVRVITGAGTPQGAFHLTDADIALDSLGHLYVTDNLEPGFEFPELAVDEFSARGYYRGRLPFTFEGSPTQKVNALPSAVAVAADDRIFVTSGNYDDSVVLVFGTAPATATRLLTVDRTGAGSGTVARIPAGWLGCGGACTGEFDQGAPVQLAATPDPHNRFVGWSGCETEPSPSTCFVTLNADTLVTAAFEPIPQRTLTVATAGAGSVHSSPGGIACGSVCAGGFDEASTVTLSAAAAAGSRLADWEGCDSEPTPTTCAVTMSAARSVTAVFEPVPPPPPSPPRRPLQRILSIAATGVGDATGTVTSEPAGVQCGGVCARVFDGGSAVVLVAHPAAGSRFLGWGGCDASAGDRCALTMNVDRTIVAAFTPGRPGPIRVRHVSVDDATALLTVTVPAGGTLTATGRGLRRAAALPLAPGRVGLRLRLSGAGQRALQRARGHELAVKVRLTLTPFDGGESVAAVKTVSFGPAVGER